MKGRQRMLKACNDFLVEIGTEELPPKSLYQLASSFASNVEKELNQENLNYECVQFFATPRRLAILIKAIPAKQEDKVFERIGPIVTLAYDKAGKPTPAALGFAKSCKVALEELAIKSTPKGDCLYFSQQLSGESFITLAPLIVKKALGALPIAKPMRWGKHNAPFIRPVHWLVLLYGEQIIPCQLFDLEANNKTLGHRFHHPLAISLAQPQEYETKLLHQGYVICDYHKRKTSIRNQIESIAEQSGNHVVIDESLLDEVTGLVEWPVALLGKFDTKFLTVPQEALISAMKLHQKYFHLIDQKGCLIPSFVFIANISSKDPDEVIKGNERVIRARLADAEFFYHTDLKVGLDHYFNSLKTIIFQNKLGSLHDKAFRISSLAAYIASKLSIDAGLAQRAGLLCKADLTSEMVNEFPELQGIMGYYYALASNEPAEVALAIKEHYCPAFSGDTLPQTPLGNCIALADRLDTLIGIFSINQSPTGEKDPFALRRAALGVLRLLIENKLPLDLSDLLTEAAAGYQLSEKTLINDTLAFILERLRAWYLEQGIEADVFSAVFARYPTSPLDFDNRIKAVQFFKQLPQAQALAAANKRVSNILKQTALPPNTNYNYAFFEVIAEKMLADTIEAKAKEIEQLCQQDDFKQALTLLATFREPIDQFFDEVMVMTENEALRHNRLVLLNALRELFLKIADISLLQHK